jgi:hypothetical protein
MKRESMLAALVLLMAGSAANAQTKESMTDGPTVACLKEEDHERYAALLMDDVSAAIAYYLDHGCMMLPAKLFVRIDHGSMQTKRVCIRPTGSYDCLWTFSGNLMKEGPK